VVTGAAVGQNNILATAVSHRSMLSQTGSIQAAEMQALIEEQKT